MQEVKTYSLENRGLASFRAMDAVRKLIEQRVAERGLDLAAISKQIGRNHAYMQQFLKRGVPAALPEKARQRLAEILDLDEVALGAPVRGSRRPMEASDAPGLVYVDNHDVRASAGHGMLIDAESVVGRWPFPAPYIRNTLALRSSNLSMIEVIGDSMEPTLQSGDKIMVDLGDQNIAQPGIFALYDGGATVVKRVERVFGSDPEELMLISDNPLHNNYRVLAELVHVAGRVVWFGRKL